MKASLLFLALGSIAAQIPNPTQVPLAGERPQSQNEPVSIVRATVVARTTKAVNYHHRAGTTHVEFQGTELMPAARGEAAVSSQMGST